MALAKFRSCTQYRANASAAAGPVPFAAAGIAGGLAAPVGLTDADDADDAGVEDAEGAAELNVGVGFGSAALPLQPDIAAPTATATSTAVAARSPRPGRTRLLTPLHPRTTVRAPGTVRET